jgi:hypothetical protein
MYDCQRYQLITHRLFGVLACGFWLWGKIGVREGILLDYHRLVHGA